jgi:hypothetical protein
LALFAQFGREDGRTSHRAPDRDVDPDDLAFLGLRGQLDEMVADPPWPTSATGRRAAHCVTDDAEA